MTTPKLATLTTAFLFLFLSLSTATAATALITSTCKQTPDVNLCVTTLTADPRSAKAADVRALTLIMIDAVKAKATTTYADIKKLLKTAPPGLQTALKNCAEDYDFVLNQMVPEAVEAVSKGAPKFGEDGMNGTAQDAVSCEGEFGKEAKSPLTGENEAVRGLATVAASMIRQLE